MPTPMATAIRRPQTPMAPPDTAFAFIETAIKAGSARGVLQPIANANRYTQ